LQIKRICTGMWNICTIAHITHAHTVDNISLNYHITRAI